MRKGVLISIFAIALFALCAAPQVRADGTEFTFTEPYSAGVATLVWQIPVSPTLDSYSPGVSFTIGTAQTITTSFFSNGSLVTSLPDTFTFYSSNSGGGFLEGLLGLVVLTPGGQVYTGGENDPSFVPGTYQTFDVTTNSAGTLIVSTPEPSGLVLLCAGLCTILCFSFWKKLSV